MVIHFNFFFDFNQCLVIDKEVDKLVCCCRVDIEVRRRRELQLKVPVVLRRIGIEACFNQMMVNVLSVLLICIFMPREVGMFKI